MMATSLILHLTLNWYNPACFFFAEVIAIILIVLKKNNSINCHNCEFQTTIVEQVNSATLLDDKEHFKSFYNSLKVNYYY